MASPKPRDIVRLTAAYMGLEKGSLGVIDSPYFAADGEAMVVFNASTFWGPTSDLASAVEDDMTGAVLAPDGGRVSSSGGPCPFVKLDDLKPAGRIFHTYWRWKDLPRAGGGINFQREVDLWEWGGNCP